MQYKSYDIDLRPGDVILFRSELIWWNPLRYLSLINRAVVRCSYNHGAIVTENWGETMINEAVEQGVVSRPAGGHLLRNKTRIMVIRPRFKACINPALTRANSKLGLPYDYASFILYQLPYRTIGKWWGRTGDEAGGSFGCFEYVAWSYDLDKWWLYSAAEMSTSPFFKIIFKEP